VRNLIRDLDTLLVHHGLILIYENVLVILQQHLRFTLCILTLIYIELQMF
jgi:hypothetical protein